MDTQGFLAKLTGLFHAADTTLILSLAATLTILLTVGHSIYQLYFSPLSRLPGPWLNALTRTPLSLHDARGDIRYYARLHARHGPVVRTGPREVSFVSAEAWRDMYGSKTVNKDPTAWLISKPPGFPHGLANTIDVDEHKRIRGAFRPAFSERMLAEQEGVILERIGRLVARLGECAGKGERVDMVKWFNLTTFDIMYYMCFSERLGLLEAGEYSRWVRAVFQTLKFEHMLAIGRKQPMLKVPMWITALIGGLDLRAMLLNFGSTKTMLDAQIEKAEKGEETGGNLWAAIKKADKEGRLTRGDIVMNASFFMIAGTETSAAALAGTVYYLSQSPAAFSKLQREVRTAYSSPAEITMKSVAGLRYLTACIQEGLRLYPPPPCPMPRLTPPGGAKIADVWLPGGTTVYIAQYPSFRYPANFHRADEFVPERWLGDEEFAKDKFDAFKPFGFGPRNCVGENLAWHEMRLILAHLVWHFDIGLKEESKGWPDSQNAFLVWEKIPLYVDLKAKDSHLS